MQHVSSAHLNKEFLQSQIIAVITLLMISATILIIALAI